jgi:hypothetical protein
MPGNAEILSALAELTSAAYAVALALLSWAA